MYEQQLQTTKKQLRDNFNSVDPLKYYRNNNNTNNSNNNSQYNSKKKNSKSQIENKSISFSDYQPDEFLSQKKQNQNQKKDLQKIENYCSPSQSQSYFQQFNFKLDLYKTDIKKDTGNINMNKSSNQFSDFQNSTRYTTDRFPINSINYQNERENSSSKQNSRYKCHSQHRTLRKNGEFQNQKYFSPGQNKTNYNGFYVNSKNKNEFCMQRLRKLCNNNEAKIKMIKDHENNAINQDTQGELLQTRKIINSPQNNNNNQNIYPNNNHNQNTNQNQQIQANVGAKKMNKSIRNMQNQILQQKKILRDIELKRNQVIKGCKLEGSKIELIPPKKYNFSDFIKYHDQDDFEQKEINQSQKKQEPNQDQNQNEKQNPNQNQKVRHQKSIQDYIQESFLYCPLSNSSLRKFSRLKHCTSNKNNSSSVIYLNEENGGSGKYICVKRCGNLRIHMKESSPSNSNTDLTQSYYQKKMKGKQNIYNNIKDNNNKDQ